MAEEVEGRSYRVFAPDASSRYRLTLTRPSPERSETLLSVPGTYTSPEDDVLGLVLIDGVTERSRRMAWGGALVIVDGRAEVRRVPGGRLEASERTDLEARKASLIQGHLLVHDGRSLSLKESPALQRRAVAVRDGRAVIVESVGLIELARFAEDLAALGVTAAMNLDMGTWSEGWYRRGNGEADSENGEVVPLGLDHRATDRQTNWLVIERSTDRE